MKTLSKFLVALIFIFVGFTSVRAEGEAVVKIAEKEYTTLEEAIKEANDGDIIELLADVEITGINLNKNLTIRSQNNHKIKFTQYGIGLWGVSLTFDKVDIEMTGIGSTPYTAEWNWMAIAASQNASLTLKNSTMVMDGTGTNNAHAIYFCSNNQLNLINSNLTIKNYAQDALEWDGGNGGYNVNIINSNFTSYHNRSGFTGTFYVTIDSSKVDVINSTGNGSNGSNFIIKNASFVNFDDNGSHGLSAGTLAIDNSKVNARRNGGNGIHTNGILTIKNNSKVNVKDNKCSISSKWTIPGAIHIGNTTGTSIIKESEVNVTDNKGTGIYQKGKEATFIIEKSANVTITNNEAKLLGMGGGVYANGDVTLADNLILYNNHAGIAGDDIYSLKNITFGKVGINWVLDDCNHLINGWYDDNEEQRWNAHDKEKEYIVLVENGIHQNTIALKAAHDKIKGNVIVKYVDESGKDLAPQEQMSDLVGNNYKTSAKEFDDYKLLKVEGNETGKYIEGTIEVVYIYRLEETEEVVIVPPYTNVDTLSISDSMPSNVFKDINNALSIIYMEDKKKRSLQEIL